MKPVEASSRINASPEYIWKILTDGPGYAAWDSGIDRVRGRIAAGERLRVDLAVSRFPFWVKIAEFVPGEKMTWVGGAPLGLFKAIRTFTLGRDDAGATIFVMREEFTGPLMPVLRRLIPAELGESFEQFAGGLKRRAEGTNDGILPGAD